MAKERQDAAEQPIQPKQPPRPNPSVPESRADTKRESRVVTKRDRGWTTTHPARPSSRRAEQPPQPPLPLRLLRRSRPDPIQASRSGAARNNRHPRGGRPSLLAGRHSTDLDAGGYVRGRSGGLVGVGGRRGGALSGRPASRVDQQEVEEPPAVRTQPPARSHAAFRSFLEPRIFDQVESF